jgi:predicted  nucleic acid-binding Zn-ribbon protein
MTDDPKEKERLKEQLLKLVSLQQIDDEVADLKKSLDIIPGQIESGKKELEGKKSKLNNAQAEIEDLKKRRNQLEQDVKVENDHMAKTKGKLPTVKTNKEYTAILSETDAIKEKIAAMEDQQLEIMETLDQKEKEIPGIEQEFKGYQEEFGLYQKQKETEQARLQDELKATETRRDEIAQSIDPKWVKHYDNVIQLRGDRAVVPLENGICQGCYQQIRPQVAIEVKNGEKVHCCQYCDRFLFMIPKPETEDETQTAVAK